VKARQVAVALFSRSGASRNRTVVSAAAPAASLRADGSGAPAGRLFLLAAVTLLATLVLGVALADAVVPTVTIEPASSVQASSAHVAGEINPQGQSTSWKFEYATHADFSDAGEGPSGTTATTEPVSGSLTGLQPNTEYHLRLVATNGDGTSSAEAPTFKTPAVPPDVGVGVSTIGLDRSITLRGSVNPHNSTLTDCHFEYGTSESYGQNAACAGLDEVQSLFFNSAVTSGQFKLGFESQVTGNLDHNATAEQVQSALEALSSIGAGNVSVRRKDSEEGFHQIFITFVGDLAEQNVPQIELLPGTTPLNGFSSAGTATQGGTGLQVVGSGSEARVNFAASSLIPGATYHFRLAATTSGGSEHSADSTFTALAEEEESGECPNEAVRSEQHSTYLPDCRAYEMASSADKRGGDVVPHSMRIRSAADGETIAYTSYGGFGDSHGAGIAVEYLANRTAGGWVSHAITPATRSQTIIDGGTGKETFYDYLSSDLENGVLYSTRSLPGTPASVAHVYNLYFRQGLGTPGEGNYQLITACPLCEATGEPLPPLPALPFVIQQLMPYVAGASPDAGIVAFESKYRLTQGTPEQSGNCGNTVNLENILTPPAVYFCAPHLYEWDHGQLRLAGILPDGTSADASFAGNGALHGGYTPHVVSDGSDGHSRIEFTQPTDEQGHTFSQVSGLEQFFLGFSRSGNLYQRIDGTETIKLNRSERTACLAEPEPPACAEEFFPAEYLDASPDGERVFFNSSQALTNNAIPYNGRHLYMYDASKPASDPHNLTLIEGGDVTSVWGFGGEGSYAYFEGPAAWHDGETRSLGERPLTFDNEDRVNNTIGFSRQSRVTPDGKYFVFATDTPPFPGGYDDHGPCNNGFGCRELYVYNATDGQMACVSCNPSGDSPTGSAVISAESGFISGDPSGVEEGFESATSHESTSLTADGRYVFFNSPDALVSEDTNGKYDAYEYDTRTGEVHLLSSGTSADDSFFVESANDGRDAFIVTDQPLVGRDKDKSRDLYDVHVDGGFPEPAPKPALCNGESCQGAQHPTPPVPPVGSGQEGAGNPKPKTACGKGLHPKKVHGKTRCVKPHNKKQKRHRKHHRNANHDRRAAR
jgi:hypothetical protein